MSDRAPDSQDYDREVIGYELHDGPCQSLAAARMYFELFRTGRGSAAPNDWAFFDRGVALLDQAADELRRVISDARPPQMNHGGLPAAIERLLAETQSSDGPEIEFYHDLSDGPAGQLAPQLELAAFRIVQQCVANACGHSKSRRILIGLTQDTHNLSIQIQDWGIGFDPAAIRSNCFGLEGVMRRAELLGGTATVQSHAGKGTCVTVDLPLSGPRGNGKPKPVVTLLRGDGSKIACPGSGPSDGTV